jgi:hypothetical protein
MRLVISLPTGVSACRSCYRLFQVSQGRGVGNTPSPANSATSRHSHHSRYRHLLSTLLTSRARRKIKGPTMPRCTRALAKSSYQRSQDTGRMDHDSSRSRAQSRSVLGEASYARWSWMDDGVEARNLWLGRPLQAGRHPTYSRRHRYSILPTVLRSERGMSS